MNSKVMFNDAKLNQDNRKCRNFHFKRLRKVLIVDTHKIKVRHEVLLFFSKHITLLQTVEKCI
jgi:hypothetical protein